MDLNDGFDPDIPRLHPDLGLDPDAPGDDLPPVDDPPDPGPRGRPDRIDRRLPVGRILAFMAVVVAVERLSMLTFVIGVGPALVAVGGTIFFVGNALLWWFGSRWLGRRMAEARPPRDASERIVRRTPGAPR